MITKSKSVMLAAFSAVALIACSAAVAQQSTHGAEIPRAASTPNTPKNWVGPSHKILAQQLVDELQASHPEIMSITIHALPAGQPADAYTMIAGTFPDRIGNTSSPGDVITARKGVTQVESKWGTPDYGKKVSVVLPLKDASGAYIPVAMVVAFHQSETSGKIDTDFMAPGLVLRNGLQARIISLESLYAPV